MEALKKELMIMVKGYAKERDRLEDNRLLKGLLQERKEQAHDQG